MAGEKGLVSIDEFVSEFGQHVDAQAAALFVGAGLSAPAGLPTWDHLLQRYREATELPDFADGPLLVQYFQNSHENAREEVRKHIIEMVRAENTGPTETHRRLLQLPIYDLWTSNYDRLIELAADRASIPLQAYDQDADLASRGAPTRRLYKMSGSVGVETATDELVISRDDFEQYPTSHPRFWQLLGAHYMTRTFLFLGFSLTDPNIMEIFRLARLHTADRPRPHFALIRRPSEGASRRLEEYRLGDLARVGVRIVQYDEHDDLNPILARVNARCLPTRLYIAGSYPVDQQERARVDTFAIAIARLLVNHPEIRLMTGNDLGAGIGYYVSREHRDHGRYDADDLIVIRRALDEDLTTSPHRRLGSILFDGDETQGMRSRALNEVRAVLAIAGTDRTRSEMKDAAAIGMGVIPVGATGGSAREQWEATARDLSSYRLGERPVERGLFMALADGDPGVVARAAIALAKQGLSLA